MKVLHVTYADSGGGAARAAYRLHGALRDAGIDSSMLVMKKGTADPHVHVAREWFPGRNGLARRLHDRILRAVPAVDPRADRSLNLVPSRLQRRIHASDADVVHLHWVHEEMISVAEIARIEKPIVWTLHDAWACGGSEHYPAAHDARLLERFMRARKRRHWSDLPLVLVAPSRWMAGLSGNSAIFQGRIVHVIPNPVPTEFSPRDRKEARRRLGLSDDTRTLLFGAHDVTLPRKGADLLGQALHALGSSAGPLELLAFGGGETFPAMPIPVRRTGWITGDLATLYGGADVLLAPSRIDNLPNTVAEAAASGLPTVAFRVGGLPDLVCHRRTGYLAEPFDVADFVDGIRWVLGERREALQPAVLDGARRLQPEAIVPAYLEAYRHAIDARRRHGARVPVTRLGSQYGGWTVPASLLPRQAICYSIGVGEDTTFDRALIERCDARIFAFDPTPRAADHVAKSRLPANFTFLPVGVWDTDGTARFYAPADPAHVSHSIVNAQATSAYFDAPCRRLSGLMAANGHDAIDLLKMDIEGAEYRVIDSLIADGVRARVLCVEFHQLHGVDGAGFRLQVQDAIRALARAGYGVVAAGNGRQYSFVRDEARPS